MVTKKEFIDFMAGSCNISKKDATEEYEDVMGTLVEFLSSGDEVSVPDLGRFKIVDRDERMAHNPQTGEEIVVPAHKALKFAVAKNLKETISEL